MLFLTGNAEGFMVSEKTILDRCNISESGYKKARKKLAEKQWIFHKPGEYIQVNFNKIFSDYRDLRAGCPQKTAQEEKNSEGSSSASKRVYSVNSPGNTENTQGGSTEYTYNNIMNNISYNTINNNLSENNINESCEDTRFAANAASQVSSQSLREKKHTKEEIDKVEREFNSWFARELRKIESNYSDSNEDWARMCKSDEYKAFQKEANEKREALKKEYGRFIRV